MTGHLVKLGTVVALQCGKKSDIRGLEQVAAVGW